MLDSSTKYVEAPKLGIFINSPVRSNPRSKETNLAVKHNVVITPSDTTPSLAVSDTKKKYPSFRSLQSTTNR